jgi:hypothetical protein
MGRQLHPGDARRRAGDSTRDQCLAQTLFHEAGLVLRCVPRLDHDKVTCFVETGGVCHQPVGPVALARGRVDAEHLVDRVVLLDRDALEFQRSVQRARGSAFPLAPVGMSGQHSRSTNPVLPRLPVRLQVRALLPYHRPTADPLTVGRSVL